MGYQVAVLVAVAGSHWPPLIWDPSSAVQNQNDVVVCLWFLVLIEILRFGILRFAQNDVAQAVVGHLG